MHSSFAIKTSKKECTYIYHTNMVHTTQKRLGKVNSEESRLDTNNTQHIMASVTEHSTSHEYSIRLVITKIPAAWNV
jgi:hypothetical protein